MRLVIQRSLEASVRIDGQVVGRIDRGLVLLVGVEEADTAEDADWLAAKTAAMRLFADAEGKMNLNVTEAGGRVLAISQFTLFASTKKGNRPGFTRAARPEKAVPLYEHLLARLEIELGAPVERGVFGADMQVALVNDGPVTIVIDSRAKE
jgi:D-tyrosyl-tRNA(Tyr) deacylase